MEQTNDLKERLSAALKEAGAVLPDDFLDAVSGGTDSDELRNHLEASGFSKDTVDSLMRRLHLSFR